MPCTNMDPRKQTGGYHEPVPTTDLQPYSPFEDTWMPYGGSNHAVFLEMAYLAHSRHIQFAIS